MQGHEKVESDIRKIIADFNSDVFIVDIFLNRGPQSVLSILVDTDPGINIDECAKISRQLNRYFEEENPWNFPFRLEVSSPGVNRPLVLHRQYIKNIGRKLKVFLEEGGTVKGKLESVDEEKIVLRPAPKKKKKKGAPEEPETIEISFDMIKEAKVEISFD